MGPDSDDELDPRIQIELENLNKSTDEINRLEIELDEANTTFRMLLNESTRRLKLLSKKLGTCIEKSRPYYEALEIAKKAQLECQKAAVAFQRSNEIHAAAKETVALAEQRFLTNQHEWQFDNAWQEMLNHATMKVMDADNKKSESGREHQKRALLFNTAEQEVQQLEDRFRRQIIKARPYFDEKTLCQDQLNTQKQRIETLRVDIIRVKSSYAASLKHLELISNEIHEKRQRAENDLLARPREPGVGAELCQSHSEIVAPPATAQRGDTGGDQKELNNANRYKSLPDFNLELDLCEVQSCTGTNTGTTSSMVSEHDLTEPDRLLTDFSLPPSTPVKQLFKNLQQRPVDGGEGQSTDDVWDVEVPESSVANLEHSMRVLGAGETVTTVTSAGKVCCSEGGVAVADRY